MRVLNFFLNGEKIIFMWERSWNIHLLNIEDVQRSKLIDWLVNWLIDWLVRLLPLQYSVENCKLCGSQHNTSHRHYSGKYGQFYVFLTLKHCFKTNINGFGQILKRSFVFLEMPENLYDKIINESYRFQFCIWLRGV